MSQADFEELLAVLDLKQIADDTFIGSHPSKNPVRTFGGQMLAQAFVAGSRFSNFRDAIAFVILIAILLLRPSGLFGKYEAEKV